LRKARRYPSAAALAILSFEELGKFISWTEDFSTWVSPPEAGAGLRHPQKLKSAAHAAIWGLPFDEVSALLRAAKVQKIAFTAIVAAVGSIDDRTYASEVANIGSRSKHLRHVIDAAKGEPLDKIKQQSLYVDRCDDGSLRVPTKQIDRLKADEMIRLASGAIYFSKRTRRYARKARSHLA
jgi:AbiV family abortive infection protein